MTALVVVSIIGLLAAATAVAATLRDRSDLPEVDRTDAPLEMPADRTRAPVVDGAVLTEVSTAARAPEPVQWSLGDAPIPSNTWWASAVSGPGAQSLWPQPLALRIEDGVVAVAAPEREERADGSIAVPLVPALSLDLGGATTSVVEEGDLHVRLRLESSDVSAVELTLVQGSPLLEVQASGPITFRVPALDAPGDVDADSGAELRRSFRIGTSQGDWLVASDEPVSITSEDDVLVLTPGAAGRLVLGPVPDGAESDYDDAAARLAAHPVVDTTERLTVAPDGTTSQDLVVARDDGVASLWALQPHHQRYTSDPINTMGAVSSAQGRLPVVAQEVLRLRFPAVPVLWSSVGLPRAEAPSAADAQLIADTPPGSYFAGKAAQANAAQADVLRSAGDVDGSTASLDLAASLLDALIEPEQPPWVRWERGWGSAVIEPAEFGAGEQLNDHLLQYAYWVAAAGLVAEVDDDAASRYRETIDLLIADYAGAATVPGVTNSLPDRRTWSPYEGHSWSSGIAPFEAGNNLESISESSFGWWAAARWFLVTGRPAMADEFIARLTIESALTGFHWLPDGASLPAEDATRPWSGVVWSSKVDRNTWFDEADESALGIRLLPLGPNSLARYGTAAAIDATSVRWDWCRDYGDGCTSRWANLLDSDAAVAGLPALSGPDPEPSTTALVSAWWRDLWERTSPPAGWTCSPGAVVRVDAEGAVVVLASNPGPHPVTLTCHDADGTQRWSASVRGAGVESIVLD